MWIYKSIVNKTTRLYLFPYFETMNLSIIRTSFAGFFSSGDFETPFFEIVPVSKNGKIFNNTYANIYVKDNFGRQYRFTVKIRTFFLRIQKVILKSKEMNIETELSRSK